MQMRFLRFWNKLGLVLTIFGAGFLSVHIIFGAAVWFAGAILWMWGQ
jgi:hypothetical protein